MKLWFERGAWASAHGRHVAQQLKPDQIKRIAVIRHAALGDMVLVRPFLVEARKFFPHAELVLSLVTNYMYGAPVDLVDSVHIMPGSDKKEIGLKHQIAQARKLGPVDLLFDFADTTRSRYLCFLSKAKLKIGFPYRAYLRNLLLDLSVPRSDFQFEGLNIMNALMLLGAKPAIPLDFGWPVDSGCTNPTLERESKIVYFPFASVDYKCWPGILFINLVERASRAYPEFTHLVLGGVGTGESLDSWPNTLAQRPNIKLCEAISLAETTRQLITARCVVSNDTGVRNLAIALGTPTIGIFFSTVPYRYWPLTPEHEVVFNPQGEMPSLDEVFAVLARRIKAFT